ncbi:MAG: hypothetical protein Q8Q12_10680 [bacterium]|nr:hypothetical protein [bacterium]
MKKAKTAILILSLALVLSACNRKTDTAPASKQPNKPTASVETTEQDPMLNEPLVRGRVPEELQEKAKTVCKKCGRHVKADAASCPICKSSGDFKREKEFYTNFFRPWKWSLLIDGDEIWATGWGGVSVYSIKEMKEVRRITEDDGVHSNFLGFASLAKDEDGGIFVSGGGIPELEVFGLSKWDGSKWISYTADVGLTPRNIGTWTLVRAGDSTWAGGPRSGIVRIRPRWKKGTQGDPWRRYWGGNFDLIPCDNVMDIAIDRDDAQFLWLALFDQPEGGDIGGKWRRPAEGISPWKEGEKIEWRGGLAKWSCAAGRDHGAWSPDNSESPTGRGLAVAEDSKGQIWFGGDEPTKGLGCFDKKSGTWKVYNESNGCPVKAVWDIVVDKKDNVWVTHARDPIYCFDGKTWTKFEPEFPGKGKAGIPGGDALRVLDNGNFIVSTEHGLLLYDAASKSWKPFQDLPYPYEK